LRERDLRNPALERYHHIAQILTDDFRAVASTGEDWVRQLTTDLHIQPLGTYGLREEHIPDLVVKAQNASSMKANPIVLTPDELADILRQAI
jgi:alcohol dehydrogenase class IV